MVATPQDERTIIAVDSQMLETLQLCEQKYEYSFVHNIGPMVTKDYLERGLYVHLILAEYYRNGKDMSKAIEVNWKKAAELKLSGEDIETVHRNMVDYDDYYSGDRYEAVEVDGVKLIEKPSAKILFENDDFVFLYQGIIDLVISNSGEVIVDHKHATRRGNVMDLSNQFIGYCWLSGCDRLIRNEIGFQKSLTPSERFRRDLFSYPQSRIDDWVENTIKWIKDLVFLLESKRWKRSFASCKLYDGCIYSEICGATPDFREEKIKRNFTVKEVWDVGRAL